MKVEYSEDGRTALFNTYKFRLDLKTGYYLSTKPTDMGRRERLHCYVWRFYNGDIPNGYHVHHVDENKKHNDIENLRCVPGTLHVKHHSCERAVKDYDSICKNLIENAVPKASEWHRSAEGRSWHSEHAIETTRKMKEKEFVCQFCGKPFFRKPLGTNRFCSNNCKTAARRKSGIDDETRICKVCGKEFRCNKYQTNKYCSHECAAYFRRHKNCQESR